MDQEKMKELLADQTFVTKIMELETAEEVSEAFAAEGLTITPDELNKAKQQLASATVNGELSEDELEDVAGGFLLLHTIVVWTITAGAAIGAGERITNRRW